MVIQGRNQERGKLKLDFNKLDTTLMMRFENVTIDEAILVKWPHQLVRVKKLDNML